MNNKTMFSFVHLQPIKWTRPAFVFAFLVVLISTPIFAQEFVTDIDKVTVPEGETATFQVKLSSKPSSDVSVSVSWQDGDTDISVSSGSSLTFESNKWNKYQTVTLTAIEDADTIHGQATIRISDIASVIPDKDITATEQDNDINFITDKDDVTVPEGSTQTFQVELSAEPLSDVSVIISRLSGDSDITVQSGSSLTFTTTNWGDPQTVTLAADEDDDADNNQAIIRLSDNDLVIPDKDITATEEDNDELAFVTNLETDTVTVPEGGTTSFEVKLSAKPSSDVEVTVSNVSGDTDITVISGSSLTFTPNKWDKYQTVTLEAAEDDDVTGDEATIRISDDDLVIPSTDITAIEQDNDELIFVTQNDPVTIPEGGENTFKVKLSAQPSSDVEVTVSNVVGDTDIRVKAGSEQLAFTSDNWNKFQTVTLEAQEDYDIIDGEAIIRLSALGVTSKDITATEQDNDSLTFITDVDEVTVPEGGTASFQVKLSNDPSPDEASVTVSRQSGDSDISIQTGENLTFDGDNWNEYQPVTLEAAEDEDTKNSQAKIRISAAGIPHKDITATEQDNDSLTFITDTDEVTVPEGGTASFQVKLSNDPSPDEVSVTVSRQSGDNDISIQTGENLTFDGDNWEEYQTVTLEAAEDEDTHSSQAKIRISSPGIPNKDITATEQDNDNLTFVTDVDEVTVPEGGTATFHVKLSAQPSLQVLVSVSKLNGGDEDISVKDGYEQLTFTFEDWDEFQEVILEAAEDADTKNGHANIRISDLALAIPHKDITAFEDDNDELRFVTDNNRVTVPEGETDTFKIKLSAEPSSDILVTICKEEGDPDITLIPDTDDLQLKFTPDDWNKFQTVTLAAIEDEDVIDGEATILISAPGIEDKYITAIEQDNDIADIYLKLNPHTGTTGNIIKISIDISNNTQEIDAFGLDFFYDNDLFILKSIKKGSLTSDWSIIGGDEESPGTITIGGVAGGGKPIYVDSKGTLVRIWLKVRCESLPSETVSEVRTENYLDDIDGFSPEPCRANITLVPCSRVGDVNGDGDVTPGDAQNTLEIYLGRRVAEFCQETTSDSNGDARTTPGDAQDIFEHYLGKRDIPECHEDESTGTTSVTSFASLRKARDNKRIRPSKPKLYPLNTIGYSGKTVNIPIIISNPEGITSFSFDVNYLPELLEYTGIRKTELTNEFDYLRGIEEIEGLVRVEGESKQPITSNKYASLAVLVFRVKEGANGSLPIIVFNPGKDLFDVEIEDGTFLGLDYFDEQERFLNLGKAIIKSDMTLRIPVEVSSAFNIKSFGLEIRYPTEKMLFAGINRGELTKNFVAVEGNESEPGKVRIGGYSTSGIQERKPGVLVEIVFWIKETDGEIEIVKLVDDIQDFIIQKRRIKINEKRDREKKPWFRKLYDHR